MYVSGLELENPRGRYLAVSRISTAVFVSYEYQNEFVLFANQFVRFVCGLIAEMERCGG